MSPKVSPFDGARRWHRGRRPPSLPLQKEKIQTTGKGPGSHTQSHTFPPDRRLSFTTKTKAAARSFPRSNNLPRPVPHPRFPSESAQGIPRNKSVQRCPPPPPKEMCPAQVSEPPPPETAGPPKPSPCRPHCLARQEPRHPGRPPERKPKTPPSHPASPPVPESPHNPPHPHSNDNPKNSVNSPNSAKHKSSHPEPTKNHTTQQI